MPLLSTHATSANRGIQLTKYLCREFAMEGLMFIYYYRSTKTTNGEECWYYVTRRLTLLRAANPARLQRLKKGLPNAVAGPNHLTLFCPLIECSSCSGEGFQAHTLDLCPDCDGASFFSYSLAHEGLAPVSVGRTINAKLFNKKAVLELITPFLPQIVEQKVKN